MAKKKRLTKEELATIKTQREVLLHAKVAAEMLETAYEFSLLQLQQKYDIPIPGVLDVNLKTGVITEHKSTKIRSNENAR